MSEYENPSVFDLLDEAGIDLDDPQYDGMDAFDVAEQLGLDTEGGDR